MLSLSRVYGHLCPFFPGFSFPNPDWAATMSSSSRRCPCPVGPSLPPCSFLVVRSGGNFRLVVSGAAFLTFSAGGLLAMGVGLLHFRSLLSVSTFLVFAAVVFLQISRVLVSLTLPSVGLGFLRWTVSLHLSPLLTLLMGVVVLVSWVSAGLAVSAPFRLFSSCQPFCSGGNFFFLFFLYYFI